MGASKPVVLPAANLAGIDVIDGGDTLALRFAAEAGGEAFLLLPVEAAAGLASALARSAAEARRIRAATLQGRPLPAAKPGAVRLAGE
ncbi:hypothetical protein [Methylobacterium sp. JK268]